MSEDTEKIISEIEENSSTWRAQRSDLPVTLLILSRVIRVWSSLKGRPNARDAWENLIKEGDSLATSRNLFVAAEAIGHLPEGQKDREQGRLRDDLGVVIENGEERHKVRALRALSFIASEECIPLLKKGLRDADPWVQATALRTFLRLDLRGKTPRKELTAFLFREFLKSISLESLGDQSIFDNASRYFSFNRGLLTALWKERGGKRLIFASVPLWFASSLVTFVAALLWLTVPFAFLAIVVPIVLTIAGFFIAVIVAFLLLVLSILVVTVPVWSHIAFVEPKEPRPRSLGLIVLDYVLAGLLVMEGLMYGILGPAIFLGGFVLLLGISTSWNDSKIESAERFRTVIACSVAALFCLFAVVLSHVNLISLGVFTIFVVHATRLLVSLDQPFFSRQRVRKSVRWVTSIFGRFFHALRRLPSTIKTDIKYARIKTASENERRSSQVHSPGEQPIGASTVGEKAYSAVGARRLTLRSYVIVTVLIIAVLVSGWLLAPYLGQRLNQLGPQILSLGPWFRSVAVNHKYYLYGIAGLLTLAIYCSVALACVWCLWNEQRILEKIRFRVSAKGGVQQDNVEDFIADRFQQIRDDNRSIRDRVYFVENLKKQYPNPSKDHLHNLRMLSRETLPVRVKTAIEQAIDAGERSSARSRLHAQMDETLFKQRVEDYWKERRKLILPPVIARTLYTLVAGSLLVSLVQLCFYIGSDRLTDLIAQFELVAGGVLIYRFMRTSGRSPSRVRKWLFFTGLILVTVGLTHPLQNLLLDPRWPDTSFNVGLERIDGGTLRSLLAPTILAFLVAQLGHTFYLLESHTPIAVKSEAKWIFLRSRTKLRVLLAALVLALTTTIIQSAPMQELLDLRGESMPVFVINEKKNVLELQNLPTDGRVVRVVLVNVEPRTLIPLDKDPTIPAAYDAVVSTLVQDADSQNYTPSLERTFPFKLKTAQGIHKRPRDPRYDTYGGEIWLTSKNGQIESWEPLRISCLELHGLEGSTATFKPKCLYNQNRLVAIVYNKRRSDYVRGRAETTNVLREFEADSTLQGRLLVDTLSPFARTVWSHIF